MQDPYCTPHAMKWSRGAYTGVPVIPGTWDTGAPVMDRRLVSAATKVEHGQLSPVMTGVFGWRRHGPNPRELT